MREGKKKCNEGEEYNKRQDTKTIIYFYFKSDKLPKKYKKKQNRISKRNLN